MVRTALPEAVINIVLAISTVPSGIACACKCVVTICTVAMRRTIFVRTLINVRLTGGSLPPGIANARVRVDAIHAASMSRAVFVCTLVHHALGCRQPARGAGWKIRGGRASAFDG
jgi:hypothetical protein